MRLLITNLNSFLASLDTLGSCQQTAAATAVLLAASAAGMMTADMTAGGTADVA